MAIRTVGIREFRDNLSAYLLDSDAPVAITRHGETVGYYYPARKRPSALRRIAHRDPDDWPVLATALLLKAPIWTEDRDFFGTGVGTWTTNNVEVYLRAED